MKRVFVAGFLCMMVFSLIGCVSYPTTFETPKPTGKYKSLGEGQGTGVGFMLLGFIPINQNGRFQRAYSQALDTMGGDAMVDIDFRERWFWTPAGNGYITTISGEVVKETK